MPLEPKQIGYCAQYTLGAPPPDAPRDLAGDIAGLVLYHWIEQDGRPAVPLLSYWKDRASFEAGHGRFERALALPPPRHEGFVHRPQAGRKPLWKRGALWIWQGQWGRNALALVGFWTAIVLPVYHYLAGPLVTARFNVPADGIESERLAGSIRISNHRATPVAIEVPPVTARQFGTAGEASPVTFEGIVERIGAHGVLDVPIELTLPPAGTYGLEGSIEATSGLLRLRTTASVEDRLQVWPALPRAYAQPLAPDSDPRRARLTVYVLVGPPAPAGIRCGVTASPPPGARLQFGTVYFSSVREVEEIPDASSAKLSWTSLPLEKPFNQRQYAMDLEAVGGTIDWGAVVVTPRCAFAEGT